MSTSKIPVIIVLTQADNVKKIKNMTEYIKSKGFEDIIDILAKDVDHGEGVVSRRRGLDKLIEMTIKKCRAGFDGLMKKVYMEKLTEHINHNLSANNNKI